MGFLLNYLGNLSAMVVGRRASRPLLFSYYITHRCSWHCVYCSDGIGRPFTEELCEGGSLFMNIGSRGEVSRCIDTLEQTAGNILTDDLGDIRRRLAMLRSERPCAACWTSCRGFAECMYKAPRLRQFREFFTSVEGH